MRKRRLLHNYKLKGISLLLAILSWGIVNQITNNDKTFPEVPVRVIFPEGWAIRDKDVNTVRVTFRGTRDDLADLNAESIQVVVDLRNEEYEPEKVIVLRPRQVTHGGNNSRITSIQPDILTLKLGREGEKQLPILVNQIGNPPAGFKVDAIVVEPPLVTLVGAEDLLETINALQTTPLLLSEKIQSFDQRLDVLPPSPDWVGEVEPSRVLVRVTVAGLTVERKLSGIPLMLTHPADQQIPLRQKVEPPVVDVFLKGSPQLLDELDLRKVQAFVSAENLENQDSDFRKVNVLVPAGLEVLGVQPDQVRIRTVPPATPVSPTPTPVPAPTSTPKPTPFPTQQPVSAPETSLPPAS